jgi:hypothetical protein
MNGHVHTLLDFHATRGFGSRDNRLARQQEARAIYSELTPEEQAELAETVIAQASEDDIKVATVLCCLACFQPGSLTPFHKRLVEQRILYPGVIFHGAESRIAADLIALLEDDEHLSHALCAMAWIGDETVQSAFAGWKQQPPGWASKLYVPPDRYAHEASWELTQAGKRRDLFTRAAIPLITPGASESSDSPVQTGIESESSCPWCGRRLIVLLGFENIGTFIPTHGSRRALVLTCDVCTCFGTVFARTNDAGETVWHDANAKPDYLPPDSSDWGAFPKAPLVLSGQTRHYLEAANWSMLPGVAFSQVGGLPTWLQDADFPSCPDCSNTMPFVGQISNEDIMEYGEGIYYCFHCPQCDVTATSYQQT